MLVKDLIEDLKTMDPEAAVCFAKDGIWTAIGIRYGHLKEHHRGYVVLIADTSNDHSSEKHISPEKTT